MARRMLSTREAAKFLGLNEKKVYSLARAEKIERETARLGSVHIVGGSLRGAGIPDIIANAEETARRSVTRW